MDMERLLEGAQANVLEIRNQMAQLEEIHDVGIFKVMTALGKSLYLNQMTPTIEEDGEVRATTPVSAAAIIIMGGDMLNFSLPIDLMLIELNRIGDGLEMDEDFPAPGGPSYADTLRYVVVCALTQMMMEDEEIKAEYERRQELASEQ